MKSNLVSIGTVSELDSAWAAGFIDGEGCITLHRNTLNGYVLRLQVSSSTIEPLERLKEIFGGRLNGPYANKGRYKDSYNRKPMWVWNNCGENAQAALRLIRPYMACKGEQADLALEYQVGPRAGRGHTLTAEQRAEKERIREALRDAKRN